MNARADIIETRAGMAKSILDVLLVAIENDSPPNDETVSKAISAASELLSFPDAVA